ncbi:MAG TPA: hypothetical protein GXZ79_02955 [Acholeplasma sp.]|nr:hypothetical protein [Acholeplasma sp.]
MMEIKKIEKKSNRYHVLIGNETYEIMPIVFIKYNLTLGKVLSLNELKDLINENSYHYFDDLALKKLKKMMTKKELISYLQSKNAPINVINQLIENYERMKFIDDYAYAKAFISSNETKYGKHVLKEKLIERGIHENLVEKILEYHKENNVIEPLVLKKLSNTKGKNIQDVINKTARYFISKGFNEDLVLAIILKNKKLIKVNSHDTIKRRYEKLYVKYMKQYDERETHLKIKQKLRQEGFTLEEINVILNQEF